VDAGKTASVFKRIARELEGRIKSAHYSDGAKLPPERDLAVEFGTSRSTIRKALGRIEMQGLIWRHVGRGTFVGRTPSDTQRESTPPPLAASPREIIEARLGIEPLIAGYAAHSATQRDIGFMWRCVERLEGARDWTTYEDWDRTLHRAIAVATQNVVFISFLETINQLRQGEPWLATNLPDLHSDVQKGNTAMHRRIVDAIAQQDMRRAMREMRTHLDRVRTLYIDVPVLFHSTEDSWRGSSASETTRSTDPER
jgi:DNA-binding FadR family transcriptional regulator